MSDGFEQSGCSSIGPINPEHLGTATITPTGGFAAGSYQTFTLVYTAGRYGVDDSGSLRIVFRFAADQGQPQFDQPDKPNFTTVRASNNAVLQYRYDPKGNLRPWDRTIYIKVVNGFLREGDTITIVFGDPSGGSPGMRLQTFCEPTFEFRVLVDPIATFIYQPLPEQPIIAIVPGPPDTWRAVVPTMRRSGEPFRLSIKAEDRWGNPTDKADSVLRLKASPLLRGLPEMVRHQGFATIIEGLIADEPGDIEVQLLDESGAPLARANALRIVAEADRLPYWADLHGQSEETIGTNSAQDYFIFARDRAFLDATAHQGNDFQIIPAFWDELNQLTARFDEPGRFVTLPGYEWSGNTALGGDRNVYFRTEGRAIRRSSHAMVPDRHDVDTDCTTSAELFAALRDNDEDAICFAHCGGRYADIRQAHDGRLEPSVEIHSSWGTFEWLLHDALELGYRVGIVANSDGHKGRPGASYPGASQFGAIGGLTCLLLPELSRGAVFDCLRKRRHYGTTGARIHLDVQAAFELPGTVYHDDPALGPAEGHASEQAMMGDIVHLPKGGAMIAVDVLTSAPIERLDLFNGRELIETIRPFGPQELSNRIRVIWEGAEYRGRFRQVVWDGTAEFLGNRIIEAGPINFLNRDNTLDRAGDNGLAWRALTTGNFGGFDAWLAEAEGGELLLDTPLVKHRLPVREIGLEDKVIDLGGLGRRVRIFRTPSENSHHALRLEHRIDLRMAGDNPIYVRLTQEDGHVAWSSPIYLYR